MDDFPMEYYREMQAYYFSVKDAEHQAVEDTGPDS
jgi:hypothetical protein